MITNSLWPNFSHLAARRGMLEMLYDAAGDIGTQTDGKLDFYVDTVGVGASGVIENVRHNCYLRVPKNNNYMHLLFRVTTPGAGPFSAAAATPEGEKHSDLNNENELRDAIQQIL